MAAKANTLDIKSNVVDAYYGARKLALAINVPRFPIEVTSYPKTNEPIQIDIEYQ
jgi:hypothetical protein